MSTVRGILEQFLRQFEASYESLNRIEISRSAFLHNFDLLKNLFKAKHVIPVLKSNAYGHGFETILKILEDRDVPCVAVDGYHEALEVRAISDVDVLVMATVLPENFSKIETRHTIYVIQDMSVLNVMTNGRRSVRIHLEFDTGMNRQGFDLLELKDVLQILKDNPQIELEGVMTHFYDANQPGRQSIDEQLRQFDDIVSRIKKAGFKPQYIHAAKTSGFSRYKSQHLNTIRPGAGLYGINPFSDTASDWHKKLSELKPVLSMYSRLVKIRQIEKGTGVGYGHTFTAGRKTKLGILPVGYYEGINETLGNAGSLRYRSVAVPIVGKICMNHVHLDLTDTKAKLWEEIEVISADPSAPNSLKRWWQDHGLYPYISAVRLSPHIRRRIVD
ncbi:MAG TPA: alanine racemase [Candidatus Saccharimonadales bacterium]